MGLLLILAGIVLLGLGLRLRGRGQQSAMLAGWGIVALVLGVAVFLNNRPVDRSKSTAQLTAEDDADVAAARVELDAKAASYKARHAISHYVSHDEPGTVSFVVSGGVPDGLSVALTQGPNPYFSASQLISNTADEVTARCAWYSYQGKDQLEHTAFTQSIRPSDMLWSSFKRQIDNPGDTPLFLDTLDAICMVKPPDAVVTTEDVYGGQYDLKWDDILIVITLENGRVRSDTDPLPGDAPMGDGS